MFKMVKRRDELHREVGRNAEVRDSGELERGELCVGGRFGPLILFAHRFRDAKVGSAIARRIGPAFPADVEFVPMLFATVRALPHAGCVHKTVGLHVSHTTVLRGREARLFQKAGLLKKKTADASDQIGIDNTSGIPCHDRNRYCIPLVATMEMRSASRGLVLGSIADLVILHTANNGSFNGKPKAAAFFRLARTRWRQTQSPSACH